MPSQIIIDFNDNVPNIGDYIILNPNDTVLGEVKETYQANRTGPGQVQIGSNAAINATRFGQAFNLDYDTFDNFQTSLSTGIKYQIIHKAQDDFFQNASIQGNFATIDSITNIPGILVPQILNVTYTDTGTGDCLQINAEITLNGSYPVVQYSNNGGFDFTGSTIKNKTFDRGVNVVMRISFDEGEEEDSTINLRLSIPNSWSLQTIEPVVTNNGYFIEVSINEIGENSNNYEYSLDGISYAPTNSFQGLLSGNYVVYVRDQFGCIQQQSFVIQDDPFLTVDTDIVLYPIENSFSFLKKEDVNDCDIYANETNTHSFEESIHNKKRFNHLVQKCDCITSQFRSNNEINVVTLYKCDGTNEDVIVEKKSNNINLFDTRDYIVTSNEGKLVFYLNGGKIYDTQTGAEIGDNTIIGDIFTHQKVGDIVRVGATGIGYVRITEIIFLESINSWVAVTNYDFNTTLGFTKITTNYNLLDYEVYEYEINFENKEGIYYICSEHTKDGVTKTFFTELINVQEKHKNTNEIISRNTKNKEINYSYGITHKMRIPYVIDKIYTPSDENEVFVKDTDIVSLDSDVFDSRTFNFKPIPTAIARKLNNILSNDTIYIDRFQYVREATPTIENLGGGSNLYDFQIALRRASGVLSGLTKQEEKLKLLKFSNAENTFLETTLSGGFISLDSLDTGFIKIEDNGGFVLYE